MKKESVFYLLLGLGVISVGCSEHQTTSSPGYPIEPVPFTSVKVSDSFWGKRLAASRDVTIPLAFDNCEKSGRYDNFIKATTPCDTFTVGGFPFDDTDVYKTIEGASYLLQTYPDPKLEAYIDSILEIVAAAQEPDGYLNTSYTMNPAHPHPWMSPVKWENVEGLSHELYNLGHLTEAAVAHYRATGKRNFLDIAIKYADCVCNAIGPNADQLERVPGHQIAEMGLAKLYLATGDKKYLDQAKYFLDRRGYTTRKDEYSQAHKPVIEQNDAVGHAVRAVYMYSGMADVAALTGDEDYVRAIDTIWSNIVNKKYYITGGIGARHAGESFGDNYELPNHEAYCETCAAIGNVYFNHRLFLLHGDGEYYDVLERTLYNGVLSGQSLEGDAFFYPNPLASEGDYSRQPWFGCACCPSNLCRFIPSLPGYIYAVDDKDVYVNLYIANTADLKVENKDVVISLEGNYIEDGKMSVKIDENKAGKFSLKLRIPGWTQGHPVPGDLYSYANKSSQGFNLIVNGEKVADPKIEKGYVNLNRTWKAGDKVEISFDMTPKFVLANDKVEADRGRVAVERGPMVYCAEWPDNDFDLNNVTVLMGNGMELSTEKSDILQGVTLIKAKAMENNSGDSISVTMIPYHTWANRGEGQMAVWLKAN